MKCPMLKTEYTAIDINGLEVKGFGFQDCISWECAWWFSNKEYQGCAVHILIRKLTRLNVELTR